MARIPSALLDDESFLDIYKRSLPTQQWLQQLSAGANIANMGGQTALGLAIGTGLGNWLGNKFWNYQQAKDDNLQFGGAQKRILQEMFGNNFDLGWTPPQEPYRFKTAQEYFSDAVQRYNPNWRQQVYDSLLPRDWQKSPSPIQPVSANPPPVQQPTITEPTQYAFAPPTNWFANPLANRQQQPVRW